MIFLETLVWTIPALIIGAAVTAFLALPDARPDQWPNFRIGATTILLGFSGPFLGVALSLVLTREKHLLRYFKTR